jgi:uncharacterized protein (DUF924 family)
VKDPARGVNHARALLDYWFGPLPLTAPGLEARLRWWFAWPLHDGAVRGAAGPDAAAGGPDADPGSELRARFGPLAELAAEGRLALWSASPRRRLALILLLDVLPRILHAGTARAYAGDRTALELALSGMQLGADAALDPVERLFLYLPLQHVESLEVQNESVASFHRLADSAPAELRAGFETTLAGARAQRSIIERFGRFPHRNAALRRLSTPEERAWLREHPFRPRR